MAESSTTCEVATVSDLESYKCQFDKIDYWLPVDERFRAHCNLYCYSEVCEVIKEGLSAPDYQQLKNGCLGLVLLQGLKMRLNFQLIHQMVMHEVVTKKEMEMWFKVDGLIARFSLLEFHVITGLPVIEYDPLPLKVVTFMEFFGKRKVSYADIFEIFKSEPKKSQRKLVMTKLLIIGKVLLFKWSEVVSLTHLSIACDPEKFESYHWGRECYCKLFRGLRRVSSIEKSFNHRGNYELFGYPLAFQAWILESFPSIADKIDCTFKYVDNDPTSLHWVCNVKNNYKQAASLFDGEMAPMYLNYGEFARKSGMEFQDEVADNVR